MSICRKNILYVGLAFLALCLLCYLFPYVHDDWAWGSSIGLDRLQSGFNDYGGRYFGYIVVIVLTRFRILRAIIMAGVLVGIGLCIKKIVKQKWAFLATITLIFLTAREVFAQSISWTSGFANYAVVALFLLVFLSVAIDVINKKKENILLALLMLVIGFCGSLIMENITIYFVIMPIIIQIYLLFKEKRFSLTVLLFLLGASLGAIWMFSNSAYHNIAEAQDSYRAVSSSAVALISQVHDNYIDSIYPFGLFKNVILNSLFMLGGLALLIVNKHQRGKVTIASISIFTAYTIYSIISELIIGETIRTNTFIHIEAAVSIIALAALICFSFATSAKSSFLRREYAILWLSFFIVVAPLFIISPVGPRCFFVPYLILTIICFLWWREFQTYLSEHHKKIYTTALPILQKFGIITAASVYLVFVGIFIAVSQADWHRTQYIKSEIAAGQKTVTIRPLPYESMMWCSTPRGTEFMRRYKLYYNIPEDIEVVVQED